MLAPKLPTRLWSFCESRRNSGPRAGFTFLIFLQVFLQFEVLPWSIVDRNIIADG